MNNGSEDQRAIIPYTTFRAMYGPANVNSLVVRPFDPAQQEDSVRCTSGISSIGSMLLTAGILGLIGLLAGYFSARRAASVDPVDALRYE